MPARVWLTSDDGGDRFPLRPLREHVSGYIWPVTAQYGPNMVRTTNDTAFIVSEHSVHSTASGFATHPHLAPYGELPRLVMELTMVTASSARPHGLR